MIRKETTPSERVAWYVSFMLVVIFVVSMMLYSGLIDFGNSPYAQEANFRQLESKETQKAIALKKRTLQAKIQANQIYEQKKAEEALLVKQLAEKKAAEAAKAAEIKQNFVAAVDISFSRSGEHRRFLSLNLNTPSGISAKSFKKALAGTPLVNIVDAAVACEKELGINALYILAHAAEESEWGKSDMARTKNNFFGYGAYDSDPSKAFSYKSPGEGVKAVMKNIKASYLTKGGRFYRGANLTGMNVNYATNDHWSGNIARIMYKIFRTVEINAGAINP